MIAGRILLEKETAGIVNKKIKMANLPYYKTIKSFK
jgi:hypothetical protein